MPVVRAVIVGVIIGLFLERLWLKIRGRKLAPDVQKRRPKIWHLGALWFVLFVVPRIIAMFK